MWEHAGIARTAKGLRTAIAELAEIEERLPEGATEELNMVQTARLIAEAALLRKESRGGHYRSDFPRGRSDVARHSTSNGDTECTDGRPDHHRRGDDQAVAVICAIAYVRGHIAARLREAAPTCHEAAGRHRRDSTSTSLARD